MTKDVWLVKVSEFWKVWKYTIGSFSDEKTEKYDNAITVLRSLIVAVNFITCFFIMSNIVHNW